MVDQASGPIRFAPTGLGGFEPLLRRTCREIAGEEPSQARSVVNKVLLKTNGDLPTPEFRYQAALRVLDDLLLQGWTVDWFGQMPHLRAPTDSDHDPQSSKARVRESHMVAVREQQAQPSVRQFLVEFQKDPRFHGLIADGTAVVGRIAIDGLAGVQPYLQLVEADVRDDQTGLRLMDIWRYFRHSWSMPYRSTPGRNLFYLVRDGSQQSHPVMGIAALGNAVIQISPRDERIGWTLPAFASRASGASDDEAASLFQWLLRIVSDARSRVAIKGLGVTQARLDRDRGAAIRHLESVAFAAGARRRQTLDALYDEGTVDGGRDDDLASNQLFVAKRADELASLLRAEDALNVALRDSDSPALAIQRLLATDSGQSTLTTALRAIKKVHVGSSLMEIIVCGGVPPYNNLLAGKLVALLMCSPQVRRDYVQRYSARPSEIASRMSGRDLMKPAELVYLGTTSLYGAGSSQYNRLRLPGVEVGESDGSIEFRNLGYTRGYGSVQFSDSTREALERLILLTTRRREIRNRFGEGVSPALRRFRLGLDILGLDSDRLLNHTSHRVVYGVELAKNTSRYLLGHDEKPDYVLSSSSSDDEGRAASRAIAEFWKRRWLARRMDYTPAVEGAKATSAQMFEFV